jgi:transposase InsO family protein
LAGAYVDCGEGVIAGSSEIVALYDAEAEAILVSHSWTGGSVAEISVLVHEMVHHLQKVTHRPRLLSDNGSGYISGDLARWLEEQGMDHVRGAPNHPQTQGKIERWHQTLKNRILLENYYLPGTLDQAIGDFIDHYNHHRYHESLGNLTPADVYLGAAETILKRRKEIKRKTIENRRLRHRQTAA